jgi:hypothetical protein
MRRVREPDWAFVLIAGSNLSSFAPPVGGAGARASPGVRGTGVTAAIPGFGVGG